MSAVATANVILFMVLLLIWLSTVIAERRRSAFPSTSTGERRENMSQVFCEWIGFQSYMRDQQSVFAAKNASIERIAIACAGKWRDLCYSTATGLARTSDLSFGSASVSAPKTSVAATANVILLTALLLVESRARVGSKACRREGRRFRRPAHSAVSGCCYLTTHFAPPYIL